MAGVTETDLVGGLFKLQPCKFEITSTNELSELDFQWSKDGEPIKIVPGGRFTVNPSGSLNIASLPLSDSGLYHVNISNSQGCTIRDFVVKLEIYFEIQFRSSSIGE